MKKSFRRLFEITAMILLFVANTYGQEWNLSGINGLTKTYYPGDNPKVKNDLGVDVDIAPHKAGGQVTLAKDASMSVSPDEYTVVGHGINFFVCFLFFYYYFLLCSVC